MKHLYYVLLLFIYLFISGIKSQETVLGEIQLTQSGLTIDASAINTKINYLIDDKITTPKLIITSLTGGVENLEDIAQLSDDKKSVIFQDYTSISAGNKVSNVVGLQWITMLIISLITLGLISNSGNKRSTSNLSFIISSIVIIGIFITVSNSLVLSNISIKVDIVAPSTFKFTELNLNVGLGSTNVINLIADTLSIDSCSNGLGKDHQVTLKQIAISKQLSVCNTMDINVNEIQISNGANLNLKTSTTGNVLVSFSNGYSGSVSIISAGKLIIDQTTCTLTTTGTSSTGSCNSGTSSKLTVSGNDVTIDNVLITCPIDSTWRVTPATTNVPVSPPISTVQAATDYNFDSTNIIYNASWGWTPNAITKGSADNEFSVYLSDSWGPTTFFLVSTSSLPSIKANTDYQISFDFKLGQPLGTYTTYSNLTLRLYDPADIPSFFWSLRVPKYEKVIANTGGWTSNTDYVKTTITFNSPVDIGNSKLALGFNRTQLTGPNPANVLIRDMKLTILSKPVTTPTLLTVDSELIYIPKPSSSLDQQISSSCPYLATDLVHWHDPSIWPNGVVPQPSSTITIPSGKRVLISPCSISQTDTYQKIIVPVDSELIFSDADFTMNIQDVYVQGKFTMGTKSCRYNGNINIVFHGTKTTDDTIAPFAGSKGIAVMAGGFIQIHGKQYHNTWTKLAATAWSGDRIIYIQDSVNWEVGQQVLITTSLYKDENQNQNEVLTIKAIVGKKIEFTTPVNFYHYGGQEYQAEVALLSRRINFSGDLTSSDSDSFGGHIMTMGEGQFAGIALTRMGQKNMKARYPLHYHLAKTLVNSYISDCSVVNSYYRCYTIHGTNNVTLTRNIAFDVYGHCYYLEDGVEVDNTLSFNLGAFVHTIGQPAAGPSQIGEIYGESDSLRQPADCAAGIYYITNAWNSFIGNAASGGWAGFSFPNLDKPIGNHRTVPIVPKYFPIKVFEGNTAHSSGYFWAGGASIYVGGNLTFVESTGLLTYHTGRLARDTYKGGNYSNLAINFEFMRFNNTKVYLSNLGTSHWGNRVEVVNYESYDNNRPANLFGQAWFSNAIVSGQSGNILSKSNSYFRNGFQMYDTYVQTILSNIIFRNFVHNPTSTKVDQDNLVLTALTFSDTFKPQYISGTINITVQGTAQSQILGHDMIPDSGSSRFFNFMDWDGSLIGGKGTPTIVGSHELWWKWSDSCVYNTNWNVWYCPKGTNGGIANVQFWVPNLIDRDTVWPGNSFVGNISLFGSGITDRRTTAITRNGGTTGPSNMGWYLYLQTGSPTYMKLWCAQIAFGEHIFLAIPYPAGTTFTVSSQYKYNNNYNFNFTQATSAAEVRASTTGRTFYFDGKHLFIKAINMVNTGANSESFNRANVKIYNVFWEFYYHITATNTITSATNGFYPITADILPSSSL